MISRDTLKLLEDKIKQIIEPLGFDLVEIRSFMAGREMMIRLLIDRQEGGITLKECAQLNSRIGQFLEEENLISENYTLEVSSPGVDRDLIQPQDFRRVLDKVIHIFFKEEQDGKIEIEGKLIKVDTDAIGIIDNKNKEFLIPFTKINKAKQVVAL